MTAPVPNDPRTLAALAAMSRRGSRAARGLLHAALSDPRALEAPVSRPAKSQPAAMDSSVSPVETAPAPEAGTSESAIGGWIVIGGSALATLLLLFAMTKLVGGSSQGSSPGGPSTAAPVPVPVPTRPSEVPRPSAAIRPVPPQVTAVALPEATAPAPAPMPAARLNPAQRAHAEWLARVESSHEMRLDSMTPLERLRLLERLAALNLAAELLARDDIPAAVAQLELIPVAPPLAPRAASGAAPASGDGVLEGTLRRASQGSRDRERVISAFLAAGNQTIGPRDAAALADEALRGVTEGSRRAAQEAILSRYRESEALVVALLDALGDAHDHRASIEFLTRWTGTEFAPGARIHDEEVHSAVLAKAVQVIAIEAEAMAEAEGALASVTARRAELAGATIASGSSPESAQLSLARADSGVDERALKHRVASADGAIQQFVAAQTELLSARARRAGGADAAQVAERARRVRRADVDVLAQAITNEFALLDLSQLAANRSGAAAPVTPETPPAHDEALALFEQAEVLADGAYCGSEQWRKARLLLARSAALDRSALARSAFLAIAELEERCLGDRAPASSGMAATAWAAARMEGQQTGLPAVDASARAAFAQALSEFRLGNASRLSNRLMKREVALLVESFGFGIEDGVRRAAEVAAARQKAPPKLTRAEVAGMLLVEQAALGSGNIGWAHELARTLGSPLPELDPAAPWSAWLPPEYSGEP